MKVSYYPGCSLEGTAKEYDESTRAVCQALGIELDELEDWNCCGASSAHNTSDFLSLALPARTLTQADAKGLDLVVPCAACYQRLKVAEKTLAQKPLPDFPYQGQVAVKHLLDFCSQEEVLQRVREAVKKPLTGLKVAGYYGCLVVRPPKVTDAVDYEDPHNMDNLMNAAGAESVNWSYKTDCCGGSLILGRPDVVRRLIGKLLDMALEAGAECLVTCCPMCQSNLDTGERGLSKETGKDYRVPIFYFTELLGLALDLPGAAGWLERHLVNPKELLRSKGLL
ncbi:CoB--CoM heterodisulfide reductase iron-sulfur subunit B family protein [Chloroflexota bacterium]